MQAECECSNQNSEENKSFGVLTVTNSASIDSYFATKLAKLRNKTDNDKSSSKAASQMAYDSCSTSDVMFDKCRKQMVQQSSSQMSAEADLAVDSVTVMAKRHKKKRQTTELKGSDCLTNSEQLCSKSLDSGSKSTKRKKKRHDTDLVEATTESNNSQNEKATEETKKRKKRMASLSAADEQNEPELTKTLSKKQKKSRRDGSRPR